jgi:hypothetical protein
MKRFSITLLGAAVAMTLIGPTAIAAPGRVPVKSADALVHRVHDGAQGNHAWCTPTWGSCRGYSHKHDKSCNVVTCKGTPKTQGSNYCNWN